VAFIGSFLDSGSQKVGLNGDYSESVVLTSGTFFALFFACFISVHLYADDLQFRGYL
jgi:hypothetical protein